MYAHDTRYKPYAKNARRTNKPAQTPLQTSKLGGEHLRDTINAYTEEALQEWEENDGMEVWESGFVRGTR